MLTACRRVHQCDLRRVQMSFLQDLGYEEPTVSSAYQRLVQLQSQENHEEFQERMVSKLRSQLLSREERSRRQSERRTRIFELHPRSGIRQGDPLSPLLFDVITVFLIYDIKSLHVDVQILLYVTQIEATATGASDCRPSGGTVFRFTCLGRGGGYRWTRLPFGWSFSLVVCQKLASGIVLGVLARLQADGFVYLYDILLVARRSKVKRGACCVA